MPERTLLAGYVEEALKAGPKGSRRAEEVLGRVGEAFGWDAGIWWRPDADADLLRFTAFWKKADLDLKELAFVSIGLDFPKGVGLPGRVWQEERAVWIPRLEADGNYPRAHFASQSGLKSACAVPLRRSGRLHAVLEFYSRRKRAESRRALEGMARALA